MKTKHIFLITWLLEGLLYNFVQAKAQRLLKKVCFLYYALIEVKLFLSVELRKINNMLRTFEPHNRKNLRTNQPQTKFTCSYRKEESKYVNRKYEMNNLLFYLINGFKISVYKKIVSLSLKKL